MEKFLESNVKLRAPSVKRVFSSMEEEEAFFKGIVKIDLIDKYSKVLYSHADKDNTIAITERAAVEKKVDLANYDRKKTIDANNKKFINKILNVLIVDEVQDSAIFKVKELELMGHCAFNTSSLDLAFEIFKASPNSYDIIVSNDVFNLEKIEDYPKYFMETLKIIVCKILKTKPQQRLIIYTLKDYTESAKEILKKFNKPFEIVFVRRGKDFKEIDLMKNLLYKVS